MRRQFSALYRTICSIRMGRCYGIAKIRQGAKSVSSRRLPHMDLISFQRNTGESCELSSHRTERAFHSGPRLLTGKYRVHRQQTHARNRSACFHTVRIAQRFAKHLVSAADSEDDGSRRCGFYCRFHSEDRIHSKSSIVFLVPGRKIRSGCFSSET